MDEGDICICVRRHIEMRLLWKWCSLPSPTASTLAEQGLCEEGEAMNNLLALT